MTENNPKFKAADVSAHFQNRLVKFGKLLVEGNTPELTAIGKKLRNELKEYQDQGLLRVAFVGQYSAGKSTIISALTGKRDIHIDADIATDQTTYYDWNGISLIDTPGLFTDRKDHDQITYEAIKKSDLLVFCLTYMLFDSLTAENFKKLAYQEGYRWKMMLVINKMSDEAGEEEQKIANYRKSLAEALKPYTLDEFPICFIDAKDYCEGMDEEDDFLTEISRFSTFINALNQFVDRRGSLAHFDTPVRIVLGSIDEAQLIYTHNSIQDSTFFEVLTRFSRVLRKERERLRIKVKNIVLEMSLEIVKEGNILATAVGDGDLEELSKKAEMNVSKHYENATNELQKLMNLAVEEIRQEVEKVFESDLVKAFVVCLEQNQNVSAENLEAGTDFSRLKNQLNWLKDIGGKAGVSLSNLTLKGVSQTVAQQGLLRSMDVAGTALHQGVLGVGKFVGFKFKPWQAVGIAKNIGNAAKFLGPILAIASVGLDIVQMQKENEREREMADIRRGITSQFQSIAKDLEKKIDSQVLEFEEQVYGEIEKQITAARQQEEEAISDSDTWRKKLAEIRQDLQKILQYITKMTVNQNP